MKRSTFELTWILGFVFLTGLASACSVEVQMQTSEASHASALPATSAPPLESATRVAPSEPGTVSTLTPMRVPATTPPTRILAPSIGLDATVFTVGWKLIERDGKFASVWETADYAAGYHQDSALPGHVGNTVLSGHHNIKGEVFRRLLDLEPGDAVILIAEGREYRYAVERKMILKEKGVSEEQRVQNAHWIAPTSDERLTLVTCWPYTGNTHRVIVVAKPAE